MKEVSAEKRGKAPKLGIYLVLHVMLAIYSLSSVFSKLAAGYGFMSLGFILCYGAMIACMGLYALGWQQVIKRMPLTVAYANKAVTLIWGLIWGLLLFHEQITSGKLIGAAIVLAGVVLFSLDEGTESDQTDDKGLEG
jgi:drug/metabolite transporter (DMT)-like permease